MELKVEPAPILTVCPNPAWQKTIVFAKVRAGAVNRAEKISECGGGKGINVARVLRNLGFPVAVAAFVGGNTGVNLKRELDQNGAGDMTISCQNSTRCCYTIIDKEGEQATELIEPSPTIQQNEVDEQLELLRSKISEFSAVCLSGSTAPGVGAEFYAQIAEMAKAAAIPVLLDAWQDIRPVLDIGIQMLKVNAAEMRELSGEKDLPTAAAKIFSMFPLIWLAVTDGPHTAWLFNAKETWRFLIPALPAVVSPIGAGDCAAAILTRRLAEKPSPDKMPDFFAEALACASASCLTAYPSVFDFGEAEKIRASIVVQKSEMA